MRRDDLVGRDAALDPVLQRREGVEAVEAGAQRLTLFRPATGDERAQPVERAPNAVRRPWLQGELAAILAERPPPALAAPAGAGRATWQEGLTVRFTLPDALPPLRRPLVLDNLTGHRTPALVCWLVAHGGRPLYTPRGGSGLNLAESVQRLLIRRALDGPHPARARQVMDWLAATVRGGNAAPTPFVGGGPRQQRRGRARQRRPALGGPGAVTHRPLPRRRRTRSPYERLCA